MTSPTSLPAEAELAQLLEPVSASAEAGRDLDGTLELSAFEMAVREPETAPIAGVDWQDERDWRAIEREALGLLGTSKDLRVVVQLARARLQTGGLPAFCQVVCLMCDLTRHYWLSVYPRLDAESGEPTARVNALEELASSPLLNQLRRVQLAVAPGLGAVTVKEAIASAGNASPDVSGRVKAALDALGANAVESQLAHLRAVRGALARLTDFVREQSGAPLRLKPLMAAGDEKPGLLDALDSLFAAARERLSAGSAADDRAVDDRAASDRAATPALDGHANGSRVPPLHARPGVIASRDDVIVTLDRVCAYYSATEPSSPVPLLLRRAQRLVPLDFLAIVRDLARDGLGDIDTIAGLDPAPAAARAAQQRQSSSDDE